MKSLLVGLSLFVALVAGWTLLCDSAAAQPPFKKLFDERYFPNMGDTAMKTAYGTSSCNFCHIGGTDDRKHHNEYGKALKKLLTKKDADDLTFKAEKAMPEIFKVAQAKVRKALETVEKDPSDPNDKKSPTFGDLLKEGKLPKSPDKLPGK